VSDMSDVKPANQSALSPTGLAIGSLVLSLIGFICVFLLGRIEWLIVMVGVFCAAIALVFGHTGLVRLRQLRSEGLPAKGMPLAIIGLVIAYAVVVGAVVVQVFSVPIAFNAALGERQAVVETDLRNAAMAQEVVRTETGQYTYDIDELRAAGFTQSPGTSSVFASTHGSDAYCISAMSAGDILYHYDSASGFAEGPCP